MSSKGVSKYCSILNYLRHVDSDLYDLLQDLCLVKILIPNKKGRGLTFLRPDSTLFNKIKSLAQGDNPEEAVEALQSMVLLDNLPKLDAFHGKGIPTYLKNKLPVKSVESSKVILSNGAEIERDPDFSSRKDIGNISVYILSKELVPVTGEVVDVKSYNKAKKEKKGGADLSGGKKQLFQRVVRDFCNPSYGDTAMELLVALYGWATKCPYVQGHPDVPKLVQAIEAKASFDTLATLAIIMRPYGNSPYLSDELFSLFVAKYPQGDASFATFGAYTNNQGAVELYEKLARGTTGKADSISKTVARNMSKATAVSNLTNYYNELASKMGNELSAKELFAEAELRVLSATMLDNSAGCYDAKQLNGVYENCSLSSPYICSSPELLKTLGVGFYYSTVYLIARSDALAYTPGLKGTGTLADIADDSKTISLNDAMCDLLSGKRAKSQTILTARNGFNW